MKSRLLKNFLSGVGVRVFNLIATFVATPILLFNLGDSGYGFMVLLLGILGFSGLLDLGLTQSLVRELAGSPMTQRQSLYATAAWLFFMLGISGAGIVWLGHDLILDYVVQMPQDQQANMEFAMALVALSLPIKMFTAFAGAVLHAMEDIHEANIAQIFGTFVRYLSSVALAIAGMPLEIVVIAFPLSFISTLLVQYYYLRRLKWLRTWQIRCVQYAHLPPLVRSASGIFLAQTSGEIALHADKFIISSVLGVSALTPYNLAYLIAARVSDIGSLIASVNFPRIVSYLSNDDKRDVKLLYWRGIIYTLLLGVLMIIGIGMFGEFFLRWWIGQERTLEVLPLLLPFLFGTFVGLPSWLNGNMLIAFNRSPLVALTVATGAIISIPMCFVATQQIGVLGGAWAWATGYAVISIFQALVLRYYWIQYGFK
jgi:O-antigen/teichoic acid export membrane protein